MIKEAYHAGVRAALSELGALEKEAGMADFLGSLRARLNNRIADTIVGRAMPPSVASGAVENALANTGNIMDPIIQRAARKMVDEDPLIMALNRSIRG
jgi:hypothetical protein